MNSLMLVSLKKWVQLFKQEKAVKTEKKKDDTKFPLCVSGGRQVFGGYLLLLLALFEF